MVQPRVSDEIVDRVVDLISGGGWWSAYDLWPLMSDVHFETIRKALKQLDAGGLVETRWVKVDPHRREGGMKVKGRNGRARMEFQWMG